MTFDYSLENIEKEVKSTFEAGFDVYEITDLSGHKEEKGMIDFTKSLEERLGGDYSVKIKLSRRFLDAPNIINPRTPKFYTIIVKKDESKEGR